MSTLIHDLEDFWDNPEEVYKGIKLNVHADAYAANSAVFELCVNDATIFKIGPEGQVSLYTSNTIPLTSLITSRCS